MSNNFSSLMTKVCNFDCDVCEYGHTEQCKTCSEDNSNFYPKQEFFDEIDSEID